MSNAGYGHDCCAWSKEQAQLLRGRRFDELLFLRTLTLRT